MGRPSLAIALAMACVLVALNIGPVPTASAHVTGSPPLLQAGNISLSPVGTLNSSVHPFMDAMGLPPSAGDRLHIRFAVENGTGPPILFEIHTHEGGWLTYYNKTASQLDDNWTVPKNASFMFLFDNPYNFSLNLTYQFVLYAPPPDMSPFLFLFPAVAGVALGWFLFVRAGRGLPADGERPDEGDDASDGDGEHEGGSSTAGAGPPDP